MPSQECNNNVIDWNFNHECFDAASCFCWYKELHLYPRKDIGDHNNGRQKYVPWDAKRIRKRDGHSGHILGSMAATMAFPNRQPGRSTQSCAPPDTIGTRSRVAQNATVSKPDHKSFHFSRHQPHAANQLVLHPGKQGHTEVCPTHQTLFFNPIEQNISSYQGENWLLVSKRYPDEHARTLLDFCSLALESFSLHLYRYDLSSNYLLDHSSIHLPEVSWWKCNSHIP